MNGKPIVDDLYCGLGGWAEGFMAEGYRCRGYDIEAHDYGTGGYPGELILARCALDSRQRTQGCGRHCRIVAVSGILVSRHAVEEGQGAAAAVLGDGTLQCAVPHPARGF